MDDLLAAYSVKSEKTSGIPALDAFNRSLL